MLDIEIIDANTVRISDPHVEDDSLTPTSEEGVFLCELSSLQNVIKRFSEFVPVNTLDLRVLKYINGIVAVPETINIPQCAMPHQITAIHTSIEQHGGRSLMGLDMGTGKTLVGVVIAAHYGGSILFICPTGKKHDWKKENKQWMGVETHDCEHISDDISDISLPIVVAYGVASKNKSILARPWTTIVVDECHKIKNDCMQSMALIPLLQRAEHLLLLTGTPQQSKPLELFNLLTSLLPKVFDSKIQFMNRYCDGKLNAWGDWEANGCEHEKELFFILQHVMIRYKTDDVIKDLPPLTRTIIKLNSDDSEFAETMAEMKAKFKRLCKESSSERDPQKKRRKSKECQYQSLAMWRESGVHKASICMPIIMNDIESHPTDKFIIWCIHLISVNHIVEALEEKFPMVVVTGKVPANKRTQKFDQLINGTTRVAVLTLDSCGEGLNLVGVSRMWFVEMDQTPALMFQSEKRAHRKGCTKPVFSNWIILNDSHDDHVLRAMKNKQQKNIFSQNNGQNVAQIISNAEKSIFNIKICSANHPTSLYNVWDIFAFDCVDSKGNVVSIMLGKDSDKEDGWMFIEDCEPFISGDETIHVPLVSRLCKQSLIFANEELGSAFTHTPAVSIVAGSEQWEIIVSMTDLSRLFSS